MKLVNIKATYRPSDADFYTARLLQAINIPKVLRNVQKIKKQICTCISDGQTPRDDDICSTSLVIKRISAGSL